MEFHHFLMKRLITIICSSKKNEIISATNVLKGARPLEEDVEQGDDR